MPQALPLSDKISQSSQVARNYRVITAQYGNGYSQRAGDGINNIEDTWSVTWSNLSISDYQTLTASFDSAYGVDYFTWQAPTDTINKKWICQRVTTSALSGNIYAVSVELKQVFDI